MPNFPYKGFCWSFGTTSFRTKNFNKTIEEQLKLLREFWLLPENIHESWLANSELQTRYFDFMVEKGFLDGPANNKPKDAREKTSGLVDLGVIADDRRLTGAGNALLNICDSGDFSDDNFFEIEKDSYLYLKQLMKMGSVVDSNFVRPFIILLYVLSKVDHLSFDEFKYLVPLCIDDASTNFIIQEIDNYRNGLTTVDKIITDNLLSKSVYSQALNYFKTVETVDESVIMDIGMNRKSRTYDRPYYDLYIELKKLYVDGDRTAILPTFNKTKNVNIGIWWRDLLFDTPNSRSIERDPDSHLKNNDFDAVVDEIEFRELFFKYMHLFKAKALLSDYLDLNKRYVSTTDIVLFTDSQVKLDIIPSAFLKPKCDELYSLAFIAEPRLGDDITFVDIHTCLTINETEVVVQLSSDLGVEINTVGEARAIVENERYARLNSLIDSMFKDSDLLTMLDWFETRNDAELQRAITDNADVPTLFEYVLGIIWYKVSERTGKLLDYLKLHLDANLLPKTHANGGEADIVYEYEATQDYPKHSLLLEATLADSTNQRRMEMEPVSRHLGNHLLRTRNLHSYCVFATNDLNRNVISDFRSRKNTIWYDVSDDNNYINGMKIIPLQTRELKTILNKQLKYKDLYIKFDDAFCVNKPPHLWYEEEIVAKL